MNILDHRILIPKSPDTVWAFVSDLSRNPSWQTDCTAISFVSPRHTGAGVRVRSTQPGGRDYLIEMTAWYDGLGYEYHVVDGAPFKEARGRVRLQEIPEGTIVQWTFTYDVGGFLGGVRNAVTLKRQLESVMIDSLRKLWKVMQQTAEPHREAKSLMRDAPDYEARMQYKSRHPSGKGEASAPQPAAENPSALPVPEPMIAPIIEEPPIVEEDTRPRVPVVTAESGVAVELPTETIPVPEDAAVRVYMPPLAEVVAEPSFLLPIEPTPAPLEKVLEPEKPIEVPSVPPVTEPKRDVAEMPVAPLMSKEDLSRLDTREISVFDLFGVPKPSVTQTSAKVVVPPEPAVLIESAEPPMPLPDVDKPVSIVVEETIERPVPVGIHTTITHELPVVDDTDTEILTAVPVVELPFRPIEELPVSPPPVGEMVLRWSRVGLRLRLRRKRVRVRWPGA